MKKLLAIILVLSLVLSLAACGQKPAQDPNSNSGSVSGSQSGQDQPSASDDTTVYTIEGHLVDATANTLSIITLEGVELGFSAMGDGVDTSTVAKDDWIEISYTGRIAKNDTAGTTVTAVKRIVLNTVEGIITDAAMHTLGITADGQELLFSTEIAKITAPDGVLLGSKVRVSYTGNLEQGTMAIEVLELEAPKTPEAPASSASSSAAAPASSSSAAPAPAPKPTVTYYSLTGVIIESSMNTLDVRTAKGNEYDFALNNNVSYSTPSGLALGSTVKITYVGTINGLNTAGATVVKVVETAAPAVDDTIHTRVGIVTEVRNYDFTIEDQNGNDYRFFMELDTRVNCPDSYIEEGSTVRVSYKGFARANENATDAILTKVTQLRSAAENNPPSPPEQTTGSSDHTDTTAGTITDATTKTNLVIETAHGVVLTFHLNDGVKFTNLPNGLMENQNVTVYYRGTITDWDATGATVTTVEGF